MKRRPFHSLLTVLLGAGALGGIPCTAPLTYAAESNLSPMTVIEENGTTWWSVGELLDFYPEVEAEKDAECGDNQDCRMEFNWTMIEKGPKYSALNNLLETQFWITSVNPANETIKVLFFDDDMMLRRMGIEEKLEIEHLYIGWFDEWKGQIYNYDHDSFTNGSVSGSHPLYDSTVEDADVIASWEEVELSVAGGDLRYNATGKLDYALYAKYNKFNAQGHFDYSSCLSAPDYEFGMECQMMVSGDQWVSFFPPREEMNDDEINNVILSTEIADNNEETEPEFIVSSQGEETINSPVSLNAEEMVTSPELIIIESQIKAPETGKSLDPSSETESNGSLSKWWLIGGIIVGLFVLSVWFLLKVFRFQRETE